MSTSIRKYPLLVSLLLTFISISWVIGADLEVPPALETWEDWVLERHSEIECPRKASDASALGCDWLGELSVVVINDDRNQVSFRLRGEAYADTSVALPYIDSRPHAVLLNGKPGQIGVRENGNNPVVHVPQGVFTIEGQLTNQQRLGFLNVPSNLVIVRLQVDEKSVAQPRFEEGKLWLRERAEVGQRETVDRIRLTVFRKLVDSVPQRLETRIELIADGSSRKVNLGQVLPVGFQVAEIRSNNPLQIDSEGHFFIQVQPGQTRVRIRATGSTIRNEFTALAPSDVWPESEIWAFEPIRAHRTVTVEGVNSVEPTIVNSPYRNVANYRVSSTESLKLIDEIRGDATVGAVKMDVDRQFWLTFDGDSVIVAERLAVESNKEQRIHADHEIGDVRVNGIPTMVTHLPEEDSAPGLTLTMSDTEILTLADLGYVRTFNAVGWDQDAETLSAKLNLPPGWQLFHAGGVDRVKESWISQWWNLWDIFLCVLVIIVVYRLGGTAIATLTTIALFFGYHEHWLLAVGWLFLSLLCLLFRALGPERLRRSQALVYWVVLIPVAVGSIYTAVTNVRQVFYPQLEAANEFVSPGRHVAARLTAQPSIQKRAEGETEELMVSGNFLRRDSFDLPSTTKERADSNDIAKSEGSIASERYPVLQTGPGRPNWSWRTIDLDWSGPVTKEQEISFVLLPPLVTRTIYAAIALLHLLILAFFISIRIERRWQWPPWLTKVLPFLVLSVVATNGNAQEFPPKYILEELEERLIEAPSCIPKCASLNRVSLRNVQDDQLLVDLDWTSVEFLAVPIPKSNYPASLVNVTSDGRDIALQKESGRTFAPIQDGDSVLTMEFDLRDLSEFILEVPFSPALIEQDLCCWEANSSVDQDRTSIVFNRIQETETDDPLDSNQYQDAPLTWDIEVTRRILFEYQPRVLTRVLWRNPNSSGATIQVPLLKGETVIDQNLNIQNDVVTVVLEQDERSVVWESSLKVESGLELSTSSDSPYHEKWTVVGSNYWDVRHEGVPISPVRQDRLGSVFHPRVGESLSLDVAPLVAVEGNRVTIERVELHLEPGIRASQGYLGLSIRAGTSEEVIVTLPESTTISSVLVGNQPITTPTTHEVVLPVIRGSTEYAIEWEEHTGLALFYRSPVVSLSHPASNININLQYPRDRWILLVGGPTIGVAILFWGVVIVTVLVALALAQLPNFPITRIDAILLAVGATLANVWALIFVGGWLISVWWRSRSLLVDLTNPQYRLAQVGIIFLTVVGIFALFLTVLSALVAPANMFILQSPLSDIRSIYAGGHLLFNWYSDSALSSLPQPWVLSLPFWFYQIAMLAWSLWLVFALFRWVRSTFIALSAPTLWRSEPEFQAETKEAIEEPAETESEEESDLTTDEDRRDR